MNVKCPHCGKEIELMGRQELQKDFGISPNVAIAATKDGKFPRPWLSFGNRKIYLRAEIQAFAKTRDKEKFDRIPIEVLKNHLDEFYDSLDEEARQALRIRLERDQERLTSNQGG